MGSTDRNQTARAANMLDFKLWLEKQPDWWLRNMILDAYYKGYLEGTTPDDTHDIQRYFKLESEHGVSMVPKMDAAGRTIQPRPKKAKKKAKKKCKSQK